MAMCNVAWICNAMQQCPPCYAGSGRGGNNHCPPVCISYPLPGDSRHQQHQEAHRIRSRVDQLLEDLDVPRCSITTAQSGALCDRQRPVTDAAAITTVYTVTCPCNAMDLVLPIAQANHCRDRSLANSVCGDCGGSVCSACGKCHFCEDVDLPCDGVILRRIHQGEAHHTHSGIPPLFTFLKMPGAVEARPVWVWNEERESRKPARQLQTAQGVEQPPFIVARQCGRFVLTRRGDIYKAPRCMWQQNSNSLTQMAIEGGAAWQ